MIPDFILYPAAVVGIIGLTYIAFYRRVVEQEDAFLAERSETPPPPAVPAASTPLIPPRCVMVLEDGRTVDLNEEVARA